MSTTRASPGKEKYVEAVRSNSELLAEAANQGMTNPVPSCPGWYIATLVAHIGEVQRFWALQVGTRAQEPQALPREAFDLCPGLYQWLDGVDAGTPGLDAIPAGLVDWFRGATIELVSAFESVEPDEAIWHWSGDNRAITHMRNQAMEATVHCWDAQNAHGSTTPIDREIAYDGIKQHFEVQIPAARNQGKPIKGGGETFHFHSTDGEGEWLVRFDGDDVTVTEEHAKAQIAVRGSIEQIFLWLWGRISADGLEVYGDRSLLERYRQLVPTS